MLCKLTQCCCWRWNNKSEDVSDEDKKDPTRDADIFRIEDHTTINGDIDDEGDLRMDQFFVLLLAAAIFQVINASFLNVLRRPFQHQSPSNLKDPLFLTPYLQEDRIQDAKEAAEVHLDVFQNVTSYAGYLTVEKKNNSNLFFWFFPSANNYVDDPVILWLQGGPGGSSLFGLFAEHGPFLVKPDGSVLLREFSWHKNHSVLYIDQPVGSGYSFTHGLPLTNQEEIADHLYNGLIQFFTIFPELQNNAFFISGESYAGKYIPAIGYAIHQRNPDASLKINLQGLLIGNGWTDPLHQIKYGELFYQIGLIDRTMLITYREEEANTTRFIINEIYDQATTYWNWLVGTLYQRITGLSNAYNYLKESVDDPTEWQNFIVQDDVREAIHVGNQTYYWQSDDVYYALYADITKSVAPWVVELLNHYRVLLFNGQLDIIVAYSLTENYLQNLNFSAADEYKTAKRGIWRVGERVAGYVKTAGNLTEVMVRDAGHMVPIDQPEAAYDLVYNFIRNKRLV